MSEPPSTTDLARQLAVLEERMKTMQAEYESALDRFRADMATHREDSAKRDKDNLRWQIGLWVATVVILGIIVRWPA